MENLRENQKRLETEMLMKQSLEKELTRVQEQLTKEKVKVGEMENDVVSKEEKVKGQVYNFISNTNNLALASRGGIPQGGAFFKYLYDKILP